MGLITRGRSLAPGGGCLELEGHACAIGGAGSGTRSDGLATTIPELVRPSAAGVWHVQVIEGRDHGWRLDVQTPSAVSRPGGIISCMSRVARARSMASVRGCFVLERHARGVGGAGSGTRGGGLGRSDSELVRPRAAGVGHVNVRHGRRPLTPTSMRSSTWKTCLFRRRACTCTVFTLAKFPDTMCVTVTREKIRA
jgi:hypothetical protein